MLLVISNEYLHVYSQEHTKNSYPDTLYLQFYFNTIIEQGSTENAMMPTSTDTNDGIIKKVIPYPAVKSTLLRCNLC